MKGISLFLIVALVWLVLGQGLCQFLISSPSEAFLAAKWMLGFWILCVLDLAALSKLLFVVFQWVNSSGEKRSAYSIQALCWGIFKLVCLGLFIIVLLKEHKIPMHGLLLGMGTLGVVPLIGGLLWSQRVLSDA